MKLSEKKQAKRKTQTRTAKQQAAFEKWQKEVEEAEAEIDRGGPPVFPYSEEMADAICFEVATRPEGIEDILKSIPVFPKVRTFYKWLFNKPEFARKYEIAKKRQQDIKIDEQLNVIKRAKTNHVYHDQYGNTKIDPAAVALAKLECDNIRWEAARLHPQKYGGQPDDTQSKELINQVKGLVDKANQYESDT